jgi:glucosamine--fructose-6-phosphate aminotransferase (isomerizing)
MNYFREQIVSLPQLIRDVAGPFCDEATRVIDAELAARTQRLHTVGCGDSYFAALATELAFDLLGGVRARAYNAMSFSRYHAEFLNGSGDTVFGISVSGGVTRTIEGVLRAAARGATTLAITNSDDTPIAKAARRTLTTKAPDVPNAAGVQVPGARSYFSSLIMLYACAIRFGEARGALTGERAQTLRSALVGIGDAAQLTIEQADAPARALAEATVSHTGDFVFAGAGPNFGSAQFCAAKMLEATGDAAIGQDVEEWAHLQYFAKTADTPTFLLSVAGRDASRAAEVRTAMQAVGRRVVELPTAPCDEVFSPLVMCLPAMLFASYRAEALGEPYFRAFGGGRSIEHGGGISRIRTSELVLHSQS